MIFYEIFCLDFLIDSLISILMLNDFSIDLKKICDAKYFSMMMIVEEKINDHEMNGDEMIFYHENENEILTFYRVNEIDLLNESDEMMRKMNVCLLL